MAEIIDTTNYLKINIDPNNVYILQKADATIEGKEGRIVLYDNGVQVAALKREDVTAPSYPTLTQLITAVQGYID